MKPAFFKLLCQHEFWKENKGKIIPAMFQEDAKLLYETLIWAHDEFKRDLSLSELHELTRTRNPVLTKAARTSLASYVDDIEQSGDIKPDSGKYLLREAWKHEVGRQLMEQGLSLTEGKISDLAEIKSFITKHEDDFIPTDKLNEVPTDVKAVVEALNKRIAWKFNLPSLSEKVPGISEGEFAYLLARPDVGKTLFTVNMIAGPGGFADQGARILYLGNEEPVIRTVMRAISSYTGLTTDQIKENPDEAAVLFEPIRDKIRWVDEVGFSISRLDAAVRRGGYDIVVVDQLDKLSVNGNFGDTHERLGQLYLKARELAKLNKCAVIGVTQASADAEGKTVVTYSMSAGSKTDKAAEADLVLGLGAAEMDAQDNSGRNLLRYCTVSKNKLSNFHGTVHYKIQPNISRCTA